METRPALGASLKISRMAAVQRSPRSSGSLLWRGSLTSLRILRLVSWTGSSLHLQSWFLPAGQKCLLLHLDYGPLSQLFHIPSRYKKQGISSINAHDIWIYHSLVLSPRALGRFPFLLRTRIQSLPDIYRQASQPRCYSDTWRPYSSCSRWKYLTNLDLSRAWPQQSLSLHPTENFAK